MHFWVQFHSISLHQEAATNCQEFQKTWKSIAFLEEFISATETHKKINFFVVFFCAKNDEGENCQQRKVLTSSPIRIAQFHEKSFFKSTKNYVKSRVFEQASVGVSNRNSKKSLETCCLKNRQKLLHSRKGANDKMSPQKPNPTYRAKLLKPKKSNTFLHFRKHENY